MSVGDVNSNARGSGARYNDGKVPLQLIPLAVIAESYAHLHDCDVRCALLDLGRFQTTGDVQCLTDALTMLTDHWRDCAAVFDYGRKKYAEWNWAKGMAWSIPLACAARHALAILEGETTDPESSLPHVGHMLCNLVMLRTFVTTYPEGNDLPPRRLFEAHDSVVSAPELEKKIKQGETAEVPVFKVGDRVRTTSGGYTFGPQSGVIVDRECALYRVRVDELHPHMLGRREWQYWLQELTLDDPLAQPLIQN